MQIMNNYLTLSILGDVFGWIGAVVIVIFLFGLVMVLARRDKRHRDESASAGIVKAAGMNTRQTFEMNTEELDLDALCDQPGVCAIMDEHEREILKAYAGGETESEIGARLLIPRSEAVTLVSELFARLEVNNRAELLKKLQEMLREEEQNVSD